MDMDSYYETMVMDQSWEGKDPFCPLKQLIHQTIDPSNNDLSSETIDPSNNESGSVLQTTDPDQSCKKINPDLFLAKMCGALTDKLNLHEIVTKILF